MRLVFRGNPRCCKSIGLRPLRTDKHMRLLVAVCLTIAALMFAGCERNGPRDIAVRYLENLQESNYTRCYAMLTERDRKNRALGEFLTEIPLAPEVGPAFFRPVLKAIRFNLGEVRREGDRAFVSIGVTAPDLPLWERTLDAAAGRGHSGGQNAVRSLAEGDFPKVNYNDGIYLAKEGNHWRVIADFIDRDRIVDLHREALVEFHLYEYAKVIAAYKSIITELGTLKFTGAPGRAARYRTELAVVQNMQADRAAAGAYAAKSLRLGDIAMRMSEERVPAIFGSITNIGTRAIDAVQIAVTWYQGRGKRLKAVYAEKHPIIVTPIEFTDFSMPVLPLVSQEKRSFGFILTAPVKVQQEAAPYVTISTIAFTYMKAPLPKFARETAPSTSVANPPATSSPAAVKNIAP
jgi:hypothetical protein